MIYGITAGVRVHRTVYQEILMPFAIVGIVTLLFIVFVVLSAKTWHWVNIVFLVLTYLVGLGAVIGAAQVLSLRSKEVSALSDSEDVMSMLEKQLDEALYGPSDSNEYGPKSLFALSEKYNLQTLGRGRTWDNGAVEQKDNNRVFRFSENSPKGDSMKDMLVYVFANDTVEGLEEPFPVLYIGSLRVVAETDDSIEIEPVFVANEDLYNSADFSWTLFEKMPADRRDAFLRHAGITDVDKMDITAFREKLSTELMPASLYGLDPESDADHAKQYEAILDRYTFDGLKLAAIQDWIESQSGRASTSFDPDPEETFVEYEFNKKSRNAYPVDASGNVSQEGLFNKLGLAVDPSLHVGGDGTIGFKEGDVVRIDLKSAEGYQRDDGEQVEGFKSREDVTEVARRFVRKLNDYPFLLRSIKDQTDQLIEEIARVAKSNETAIVSSEDAQKQVEVRDDGIEKLTQDLERLTADSGRIKGLLSDRSLQQDELNRQIEEANSAIESAHRAIKQATGTASRTTFPIRTGR